MKNIKLLLISAVLLLTFGAVFANAQAAPAYKISKIKIVPFDEQKGAFQPEYTANDERSFFNDLSISLFVTVEISGQAGSFETGRKIEVTVMEGAKLKAKKSEQIGLLGDGGKYYFPVWLDSAMCSDVKITARIIGQKTASASSRTVPFLCGE
jgi:hypothetical protein